MTVVACDKRGKPLRIGTGFVWRDDGLIATAYHVIADTTSRYIRMADGRSLKVIRVAAFSAKRDFAVLKVEATGLYKLSRAGCNGLRQGDRVLTLSSALGMEQTASEGLISAIRRAASGGKLIQFTAPISPGSSGGPLFDERGFVIGIILSTAKAGQNLNFALEVDAVDVEPDDLSSRDFVALVELLIGPSPSEKAYMSGQDKVNKFEYDPNHDQELINSAIIDLDRCISFNRNHGEAHFLRGDCLWSLGRIAEAADAYKSAVRLAIERDRHWLSLTRLEVALARLGDLHGAIQACDQQIETVETAYSRGEWKRGELGDFGGGQVLLSHQCALLYSRKLADSVKTAHYSTLLSLLYPGREPNLLDATDSIAVNAAIDKRTHTDYLRGADDYLRATGRLKQ